MTDRYENIRKALEMGPTPESWAVCILNNGVFVEVRHYRTTQDVEAEAYLIAACDPDTIRALLEERDALGAENARLREVLEDADNELDWLDGGYRHVRPLGRSVYVLVLGHAAKDESYTGEGEQ